MKRGSGHPPASRYAALIEAAARHASESRESPRLTARPELGDGIVSWHLSTSALRTAGDRIKRPRHLLFCRRESDVLAVGRVLHERMDLTLHVDPDTDWA